MASYMIHTCKQREWYVKEYLIPSMMEQGIHKSDINVYVDEGLGNLKAFLASLEFITQRSCLTDGMWHLQDDIIISSQFKKITEHYNHGIVQGFCSELDEDSFYWYSFQCIRIPNNIAYDFLMWIRHEAPKNKQLNSWIHANKYDDSLFVEYLMQRDMLVTKIKPNIVQHVDWLIGGSLINGGRRNSITSTCWNEGYLVRKLEEQLRQPKNI